MLQFGISLYATCKIVHGILKCTIWMWLVFGTNLSFPERDNKVESESVYVVHQTPLFQKDMFF